MERELIQHSAQQESAKDEPTGERWEQKSLFKKKKIVASHDGIGVTPKPGQDINEVLKDVMESDPKGGWRILEIDTTELDESSNSNTSR